VLRDFILEHKNTMDISPSESDDIPDYIQELLVSVRKLTPEQVEILNQFIKSMLEKSAAKEPEKEPQEPPIKRVSIRSREPIAAHRDDNPMDDLPKAALRSIAEAKAAYLEEMEELKKR